MVNKLMLDLTQTTVLAGFISALILFVITLFRQKRLDTSDLGSLAVTFFAGCNIPAAVYLFYYAFSPDPPNVPTKLHGYEKYIAFAGLSLLFVSIVTIWSLCKKAHASASDSAQDLVPTMQESLDPRKKSASPELSRTNKN